MVMKTSKVPLGGSRGSEVSWDFPSYVKSEQRSADEAAALYPQKLARSWLKKGTKSTRYNCDETSLYYKMLPDKIFATRTDEKKTGLQRQDHGATLLQQDIFTQVTSSGHRKIGEAKVFSSCQDDDVCQFHMQSPGMPG